MVFVSSHPPFCVLSSIPASSHLLSVSWAFHGQMTFLTLHLKPRTLRAASSISWQTEGKKPHSFLPNYLPYFENITEVSLHGWTAFHQLTPSFDINIIVIRILQLASEAIGTSSLLVTWAGYKYKESWWGLGGTFPRVDDVMQRVPLIFSSDDRYVLKAGKAKVSQSKQKSFSIGAGAISK